MKYIIICYNLWGEISSTYITHTLEEAKALRESLSVDSDDIDIWEGTKVVL